MWWWIIGIAVVTYMVFIPMYRGYTRGTLENKQAAVLARIMGNPANSMHQGKLIVGGPVHNEMIRLANIIIQENSGAQRPRAFRQELESLAQNCSDKTLIEEYISFFDMQQFPNVRWH